MNYLRLYQYRFQGIDQNSRQAVWNEIARFMYSMLGNPKVVLDPAAGLCEFINGVPSTEKWVVDEVDYVRGHLKSEAKVIISNIFKADLPASHFDGIFVSNLLEHFLSQEQIAEFLEKMLVALKPGGRIAIMGPNFKYCANDYFDCADHTLALSHVAVAEHLYAAGYQVEKIVPKFLPFSFRSLLPASAFLTRCYLNMPWVWPFLGKQFLLVGQKGHEPAKLQAAKKS